MPIISKIGRKSFKVKLLLFSMYFVLIVGACTMVYPFWLMVAGTTKTGVDTPEARIVPDFYVDDVALYRKFIEGFFNEYTELMLASFDITTPSFRKVIPPKHPNKKMAKLWEKFLKEKKLPFYTYGLSFIEVVTSRQSLPVNLRRFKNELTKEYEDIHELNKKLGAEYTSWNNFFIRAQNYLPRRCRIDNSPLGLRYRKFKVSRPIEERYYFSPEGYYKNSYLKVQYTKKIENYNKTHGTHYKSWDEIYLAKRCSDPTLTKKEKEDWLFFVRGILNLLWVRVDERAEAQYQAYLKAKYANNIKLLNKNYGTHYKSFTEIPIIKRPPDSGIILSDWDSFIQGWNDPETKKKYQAPDNMLYIDSIDFWFRDYLKKHYKTVSALNADMGTSYKDWNDIFIPQYDYNYFYFKKTTGALRWEFTKRNYLSVFDFIVLHGRGILNTVIYCALQIICALLVNPLAAYALSRFRPPSTYKILLFLMLTMAFPPMVTQIPVFLMLREFHLLNTFAALILPGLANGYNIFLLKGFFDSLPQELYESADIDGASEFRIFWQITMSLSKPILAVLALNAFTLAYSNFMMALLICQDERMWTLMPWLYQLQQRSCQGVIFTSLVIAAIPTFLIFAFCQNIIMRGIVVPVEK